jgi:hypothetical protein
MVYQYAAVLGTRVLSSFKGSLQQFAIQRVIADRSVPRREFSNLDSF